MCVPGLYIHSYEEKDIEAWIQLFNRHINEIECSMVELWAPFAAAHRLVVLVLLTIDSLSTCKITMNIIYGIPLIHMFSGNTHCSFQSKKNWFQS